MFASGCEAAHAISAPKAASRDSTWGDVGGDGAKGTNDMGDRAPRAGDEPMKLGVSVNELFWVLPGDCSVSEGSEIEAATFV